MTSSQWLLLAAASAVSVAVGLARRARRRAAREFGQQLLELLALATARSASIVPVLRRTAENARRRDRRRLAAVADAVDGGSSLSDALRRDCADCLPAHCIDSIAAVEGRPALPSVLRELAHEHDVLAALRFRMSLATVYPAVLAVSIVGFTWFVAVALSSCNQVFADGSPYVALGQWVAAGCAGAAIVTWWTLSTRYGRVRRLLAHLPWLGARLRLLATARWLRALGGRLSDGTPLPNALRETAATCGHAALARDVVAAAELAERGRSLADVWQHTGTPAFVSRQMQALPATAGATELAARVRALAERCAQRATDALIAAQRRFQIATTMLFGIAIALQWSAIFDWLERVRKLAVMEAPW